MIASGMMGRMRILGCCFDGINTLGAGFLKRKLKYRKAHPAYHAACDHANPAFFLKMINPAFNYTYMFAATSPQTPLQPI
jgi:hypothetical protein